MPTEWADMSEGEKLEWLKQRYERLEKNQNALAISLDTTNTKLAELRKEAFPSFTPRQLGRTD